MHVLKVKLRTIFNSRGSEEGWLECVSIDLVYVPVSELPVNVIPQPELLLLLSLVLKLSHFLQTQPWIRY